MDKINNKYAVLAIIAAVLGAAFLTVADQGTSGFDGLGFAIFLSVFGGIPTLSAAIILAVKAFRSASKVWVKIIMAPDCYMRTTFSPGASGDPR